MSGVTESDPPGPSSAPTKSRCLVVGLGNPDSGDDGVGLAVATRLRAVAPGDTTVITCSGDVVGLLDMWKSRELVVLVDAVQSGSSPGTVIRYDIVCEEPTVVLAPHASSHGIGVAEAIELARVLHQLPPRLLVYGIEGAQFDSGVDFSAEVEAAIDPTIDRIVTELRRLG